MASINTVGIQRDGQSLMIRRFFCLGSLNVDLTFHVPRMPEEHEKLRCAKSAMTCGGSAANTAYWLARLGAETHMLGCVGDDPFGVLCIQELERVGVQTRLIQRIGRANTGMAAIFVNPTSKRMVTTGSANAFFDPKQIPANTFQPGVHLHLATPLAHVALPVLREAKAARASTSCDLDEIPGPEFIPLLDYCFSNQTDLFRVLGPVEPREAWRRLGSRLNLVLTRGSGGAILVSAGSEYFAPAFSVEVVDRTGGGDAFDAGFLYALSRGKDWESCLRLGLSLSAQVIAAAGARPESFDLEQAKALA